MTGPGAGRPVYGQLAGLCRPALPCYPAGPPATGGATAADGGVAAGGAAATMMTVTG